MKSPARCASAVVILSALALPVSAAAQEPAASLEELTRWVRIGDSVTVTDGGGRKVAGRIAGLKPESIALAVDAAVREFPQADVLAITRREHDSLRNGALIGMGVGAGFFVLAVTADGGCPYYEDCAALLTMGTLFYAGLGAGIGAGIDALVPGRQSVIYRRPPGKPHVRLSPRFAPARQGLLLSVTF
jgi:hypothetical protein